MSDPKVWERQRRTFETTAEIYDVHRPGYPDAIFDDIKKYADLAPEDDRILEVGCGTGKATIGIASWPHEIVAIEPAAAMADVARRNLVAYGNVTVLTTSFEEFDGSGFGLVMCAQAFHWLDRATRAGRVAQMLYAHGTAAIVGNVQVLTPDNTEFFVRVLDVYRAHVPALAHQGSFHTRDDLPGHPLDGSPLFTDLEHRSHEWSWTLDTDQYIGLMGTHSNHAALPSDVRARLHDGIADLIDRDFGGSVTEDYVAVASLARKA